MTLEEFADGLRVLWNIDMRQYLACINDEDREYIGDEKLWNDFSENPHRTFAGLPDQDMRRVFAIVLERHARAEERRLARMSA